MAQCNARVGFVNLKMSQNFDSEQEVDLATIG